MLYKNLYIVDFIYTVFWLRIFNNFLVGNIDFINQDSLLYCRKHLLINGFNFFIIACFGILFIFTKVLILLQNIVIINLVVLVKL